MKNSHLPLFPTFAAVALLALGVSATRSSAAVLDPLVGVTATSTSPTIEGTPAFTVSNNSLVAGPSTILGASDSLGDSGFNGDDASDFGNFVSVLGGNITYNLGAAYNISDLLIWNFSQSGFDFVGANSVAILSSTTGTVGSFSLVGNYTFNEVTEDPGYSSPRPIAGNNPPHPTGGTANVPVQDLAVNIPDAQYIELVVASNYFDPSNGGEVATGAGGLFGINEVNFVGEVPEPSTLAMMGMGAAGLLFLARRRSASRL